MRSTRWSRAEVEVLELDPAAGHCDNCSSQIKGIKSTTPAMTFSSLQTITTVHSTLVKNLELPVLAVVYG